jgi:hypothetical protein
MLLASFSSFCLLLGELKLSFLTNFLDDVYAVDLKLCIGDLILFGVENLGFSCLVTRIPSPLLHGSEIRECQLL